MHEKRAPLPPVLSCTASSSLYCRKKQHFLCRNEIVFCDQWVQSHCLLCDDQLCFEQQTVAVDLCPDGDIRHHWRGLLSIVKCSSKNKFSQITQSVILSTDIRSLACGSHQLEALILDKHMLPLCHDSCSKPVFIALCHILLLLACQCFYISQTLSLFVIIVFRLWGIFTCKLNCTWNQADANATNVYQSQHTEAMLTKQFSIDVFFCSIYILIQRHDPFLNWSIF